MSDTDETRPSAGGSYIVSGGKLQLKERTLGLDDPEHPDHVSKRDAQPAAADAPAPVAKKER